MVKNLGTIDRALRVVAGLGLIGATLAGYLPAWGWIGVVPLATAAIGWCPAYLPFGLKTCDKPWGARPRARDRAAESLLFRAP